MRAFMYGCGAFAAAHLAASAAFAHGDHGGGGGVVVPAGTTLVSLSYDVAHYTPVADDRLLELSAQGQHAHSVRQIAVPALAIAYGLTRDVTLGVRAPYLANKAIGETGEDSDNPDVVQRGGVYGFGDMSFTGTYRFLHDDRAGLEASLVVGFKAPTGRKDAVDRDGVLFETEQQPSSGSWDGLVGASLSRQIGALTLAANAFYAVAGPGSQDTTLGDRFNYGVAASWRLWQGSLAGSGAMHLGAHHGAPKGDAHDHGDDDHKHAPASNGTALDLSLGINGQWWGQQTTAGEQDANTGGHVVYVTPGLRVTVDRWAGFVNVGIPIARELNGIQSEPRWQLSTGVAVQF